MKSLSRALIATLAAVFLLGLSPTTDQPPARAGTEPRPNIILIVTDDQRAGTLWAMPKVRKHLARPGITFRNGWVSNSLCCPSRATILTGSYSHTTGVYSNSGPYGGFKVFDDDSTVATWLEDAGYRTGLFGKYLNGYTSGGYVPPGWDEWHAFITEPPRTRYYDYQLNENGTENDYGHRSRDYSTDVLRRKALRFIEASRRPFFLYFAPYAPHELTDEPATPARRHVGAFKDVELEPSPSFDEEDVSDKPAWVQALPRMSGFNGHQRTLESLLAVDDALGEMLRALRESGELEKTLIVFTSDNGMGWGEHRWKTKEDPYRGSMKVPLIVRYDRLIDSPENNKKDLALNLDLAPTFADLAGVEAPAMEGRSLAPLLTSSPVDWREDFLIEHLRRGLPPSYCGIRTIDRLYVAYSTGEEELYDLSADPYELENLAGAPSSRPELVNFRERLHELCDPPPPGYVLPH